MSQNTLVKNIGDLATAVGSNQRTLSEAVSAASALATAAGEAAQQALTTAEQALVAGDGRPQDIIVVKAAGIAAQASQVQKMPLTTLDTSASAGAGFSLSNGDVVCTKAGKVLVHIEGVASPTSPSNATDFTARMYLDQTLPGASSKIYATDSTTNAQPTNNRYCHITRILDVVAGEVFGVRFNNGVATTCIVTFQAMYLPTNGLSAYEIAKKHGFAGTEEAWLLSLIDHRNPGELVYSLLPLNDPRLVLLDGALLATDGVYSNTISSVIVPLSQTQPTLFCTEAEWQQSVTTYGVCGKFVLDTENNTLRLPKVTGFVEGTLNEAALGSLVEAGVPDLVGYLATRPAANSGGYGSIVGSSGTFSKAEKYGPNTGSPIAVGSNSYKFDQITFKASNYNTTYGKSNTVQPQAIRGYIYMVFANGVKTPVLIEAENYVNDMAALRADVPQLAAHAASPSARKITLSLPATGGTVTALDDGYIALGKVVTAAAQYATLNNQTTGMMDTKYATANGQCMRVIVPVSRGDVVAVGYTAAGSTEYFRFIYANGAE